MPKETEMRAKAAQRTALDVGRIGRPPVEPQIKRFEKSARKRLRKLVKSAPRFGDLLFSFPGAAYAIAIGGPAAEARARAVAAVKSGAPLAAVAEALELPLWYRRLPPEAFLGPVEAPAAGPEFARYVVNVTPKAPAAVAPWLSAIILASRAAGPQVAAWLAKQEIWAERPDLARAATPAVAAYAWHAQNETTHGRRFMSCRWTKGMSFRGAAAEARFWLERSVLHFCAEDPVASGSWTRPQRVSGFVIAPLTTAAELELEGKRMRNCIATYDHFMERGGCLLFAVRRGQQSVGSLELRPCPAKPGAARVAQLEGPGNSPASGRVQEAVAKWLGRQGPFPLTAGGGLISRPVNAGRWAAFWEAYVAAVGPAAAGPFAKPPCLETLREIAQPLAKLEAI